MPNNPLRLQKSESRTNPCLVEVFLRLKFACYVLLLNFKVFLPLLQLVNPPSQVLCPIEKRNRCRSLSMLYKSQLLGMQYSSEQGERTPLDKIKEAHRRVMVANHPDAGGSHYIASKINEAKDMLLGKSKGGGSAF
ncbi:hypothetical protein RIF29_19903 [Crotalaria pallida]|uniref:Uncharacterized protein n=1 Tax=Crotalaria pallida TaxID=3830 RepID=A0AAN9IBV1_CROPI